MAGEGLYADEGLAAFMEAAAGSPNPSPRKVGVAAARLASRERAAARESGPEMAAVRDLVIDGQVPVPARLYRPTTAALPTVVYFHGGGWTTGSIDTHDRVCRRFAAVGDVAVLSVEYRLAPEHPWPAAVDDAVAATRFALSHPEEVGGLAVTAVAGDSAGGHLAALVALALGHDLDLQVLVYPNTDLTFSQPSTVEKAEGFGLTTDSALFFAEQWVPDPAMRSDPRISPLFAPGVGATPPAIVVVAEHDPLRDEGAAYAQRLRDEGVDVAFRNEPGLIHGFLSYDHVSSESKRAGDQIFSEAGATLRHRA